MSARVAPKVSLITSWSAEPPGDDDRSDLLPVSLQQPLDEGIECLDLYFVAHHEIRQWASMLPPNRLNDFSLEELKSPTAFAAALEPGDLSALADQITARMMRRSREATVGAFGFSPEIRAIATFFPDLSLPDGEDGDDSEAGYTDRREAAIKAVANTCRLAYHLGAKIVEIVGGGAVPEMQSGRQSNSRDYEDLRLETLANSIEKVHGRLDFPDVRLALELEPGPSFLISSLDNCVTVMNHLPEGVRNFFTVNADVAHAFMLGIKAEEFEAKGLTVGHLHLSDHAAHENLGGQHASDLVPGKFHFKGDYQPWIELAFKQMSNSSAFSGAIAIEMEACNDMDKVHFAVNMIRRWVAQEALKPATENR